MLHCRIFSPRYVKVDKYRHYSQHYPVVSQWSKCQSLQIMSSQCLETRTVIYHSIFLVFFKVSFHNARLPPASCFLESLPHDESAFLVGLSNLGNSLRSTYQPRKKLPGNLLPTCPGIINTKWGGGGVEKSCHWSTQKGSSNLGWHLSFSSFLKKIYFLNNNKCT